MPISAIREFALAAKKAREEFIEEANVFLDEFWVDAEKLGYKRGSDSDAIRLASYYFYEYCESYPEEKAAVFKAFGHQIEKPPSEVHAYLASANVANFIAVQDHSVKCLVLAFRCLDASRKSVATPDLRLGLSKELVSKVLSHAGRLGAIKSHKEGADLKLEAFEYWRKEIDRSVSNESAAELLKKQFPLKQRTLSRYVSEWKKLPSGG